MSEITTNNAGGTWTIQVAGFLDRRLAQEMREQASQLIAQDETRALLVDMTSASNIDSMGVGMLVSTYKSCKANELPFAIVGVNGKALDVLRITQLDKILPSYQSTDEAVRELKLGAPTG